MVEKSRFTLCFCGIHHASGTAFSLTGDHVLSWCAPSLRSRLNSNPSLAAADSFAILRYLGSSIRTCVVGAIPPSHCLELGSCCRPLSQGEQSSNRAFLPHSFTAIQACRIASHPPRAVVDEVRGDVLHSCSITRSTAVVPAPLQHSKLRPAFSAVVVERLDVKEIGEFVSQTPPPSRSFCHSLGAGFVRGRPRPGFFCGLHDMRAVAGGCHSSHRRWRMHAFAHNQVRVPHLQHFAFASSALLNAPSATAARLNGT
jgi:hypothetical protein